MQLAMHTAVWTLVLIIGPALGVFVGARWARINRAPLVARPVSITAAALGAIGESVGLMLASIDHFATGSSVRDSTRAPEGRDQTEPQSPVGLLQLVNDVDMQRNHGGI